MHKTLYDYTIDALKAEPKNKSMREIRHAIRSDNRAYVDETFADYNEFIIAVNQVINGLIFTGEVDKINNSPEFLYTYSLKDA